MPTEGEIRTINGQRQIYTPEGTWETVTPEQERLRTEPVPPPPEWPTVVGAPTPAFKVPTPTEAIPAEELEGLQELREEQRILREQLITAEVPAAEEVRLTRELEDLREARERGELGIRAQPIPQPLIGRQAEVLREQIALREAPVIRQLREAREARLGRLARLTRKLGFAREDISDILDLQKEARELTRQQKADAESILNTVIGAIEGMRFEDLTSEQQTQIRGFAEQAGIPESFIIQGINRAAELAPVQFTDTQNLKLEQAGLSTAPREEQLDFLFGAGDTGFTDAQRMQLEQAGLSQAPRQQQLDFLFGTDILSQSQLNAFANAGVPQNVARIIQQDRLSGFPWEQIEENLGKQVGADSAKTLVANFKTVVERRQSALDLLYQLGQ